MAALDSTLVVEAKRAAQRIAAARAAGQTAVVAAARSALASATEGTGSNVKGWASDIVERGTVKESLPETLSAGRVTLLINTLKSVAPATTAPAAVPNKALTATTTTSTPAAVQTMTGPGTTAAATGTSPLLLIAGGLGLLWLLKGKKRRRR